MDQVPIHLHVEPLEEGGFVATSPDVPGLVADGDTFAEMIENVGHVTRLIIETCVARGYPLPPALQKGQPLHEMDMIIPVAIEAA